MVRAAGIQIEEDYIVCVVLEKDPLKVYRWIEIDDSSPKTRQKILKDFLRSSQVTSYRIAISLPARNAIWRKFNVPFTKKEEIEKIIAYESEQYIYSYSVDDLVIDYHILSSSMEQSRLLVSAVPKKAIQDTILWVEDCGFSPYIVELDISALLHTVPLLDTQGQEDILLLDLHTRGCNILLLHKGEIKEIRAIPLKIDSLIGGVLADLHETTEISLKGDSISFARSPKLKNKILSRIKKEFSRTLLATTSYVPVYFCGDPDLTDDLPHFFQSNFSLNASLWKPNKKISMDWSGKKESNLPVALGLAFKALGEIQGGFNLRKEEFQVQTFDIMKKRVAISLTLFCIFLSFLSFLIFHRWQEKKNLYERFQALAKEKNDVLFGDREYENYGYWEKIPLLKERLQRELEESKDILPKIPDALQRCVELLEKILPTLKLYSVTIESIKIETKEILLEGRSESDLFFDLWKKMLLEISWIDQQEDSIKLLESRMLPSSNSKKFSKYYRIWARLK